MCAAWSCFVDDKFRFWILTVISSSLCWPTTYNRRNAVRVRINQAAFFCCLYRTQINIFEAHRFCWHIGCWMWAENKEWCNFYNGPWLSSSSLKYAKHKTAKGLWFRNGLGLIFRVYAFRSSQHTQQHISNTQLYYRRYVLPAAVVRVVQYFRLWFSGRSSSEILRNSCDINRAKIYEINL